MRPSPAPQSVTQLVSRLKYSVEQHVGEQSVSGEIGSCKAASSGHVYFTLKDSKSQLQCVLYRYAAASLRVRLREGMQVELHGRATVWEGRGSLQFIVQHLTEAGKGSLQQQFEALKEKLQREGLFSPERKKPLLRWPRSVGLITSASGAVIEDMRHRLTSRAPWMQAYLYPVTVQGRDAHHGIVRAIQCWSDPARYGLPPVDYLIIARGGGSLEDLWCFNEESLARAIAQCPIPIVSAIGHETDFTIADFVADLRAPTPSAAIELSTPDGAAFAAWLSQTELGIRRRLQRALELARLRLRYIQQSRLGRPQELLNPYYQRLDILSDELRHAYSRHLSTQRHRVELLAARFTPQATRARIEQLQQRNEQHRISILQRLRHRLDEERARLAERVAQLRGASPQNALDRGFALITTADGTLLRDASEAEVGDSVTLTLKRGALQAEVQGRAPRVLKDWSDDESS